MRRVLKPSGFLVLSTPNLACWYNRLLLLGGIQPIFSEVSTAKTFGRPGSLPVGHLRLFTAKALGGFLAYYGFEPVQFVGAPFEGLPRIIKAIDRILSMIPSFSSSLIVVASVR